MSEATLPSEAAAPGDRVLVKPLEQKETKRGGIIIPDTARKSRRKAKSWPPARARRPRRQVLPMDVKPGDKILYGKYSAPRSTR